MTRRGGFRAVQRNAFVLALRWRDRLRVLTGGQVHVHVYIATERKPGKVVCYQRWAVGREPEKMEDGEKAS